MSTKRSPLCLRPWVALAVAAMLGLLAPVALGQVPPAKPVLKVALSSGAVTADPRFSSNLPEQSVLRHIYEPLVQHDADGNLQGVLATSWEFIDDTTLEMTLRQGVTFHGGEVFDANSAKYTIESILGAGSRAANSGLLAVVKEVRVLDDFTIQLVTEAPVRSLLQTLTFVPLGIMPKVWAEELGERTNAVANGTGPYRLEEFVPGQRLQLVANESYWGAEPAYSRIEVRVVPESGTRIAALLAGEVSFINNLSPDDMDRVAANPDLAVTSGESTRSMFVLVNFRDNPLMNDLRIRQAMNLAIDREALVEAILGGVAEPAHSILQDSVFGSAAFEPASYDPGLARTLLAEAGYAGEEIQFFVPNGRYLMDRQIGEAIAGYLGAVGLNVDLRVVEWGQFASEIWLGQGSIWDIAFLGWGAITFDPDFLLSPLFRSDLSPGSYSNAEVDGLLRQALATLDADTARTAYQEAQEVLWSELPALFLYTQPQIDAINRHLHDYAPRPDELLDWTRTSLVAD